MTTYKTAEVAAVIGVHPNTVRLYEEWGLIPAAKRQKNGYRVFTAFHIQQFWLARTAFQIEVLQGGLRKKIVEVVKLSAQGNFDGAILLTREYVADLGKERDHAEEAICIVQHILSGDSPDTPVFLKRKETSDYLGISMDTLRNWEMNGLLTIKRKQNGYRVYSEQDIRRLKIIRSLRCANYSLEAILRMLQQLSKNPNADIKLALNTPRQDEDIISVCDKLIVSLSSAEKNAIKMLGMLQEMKKNFCNPPSYHQSFLWWYSYTIEKRRYQRGRSCKSRKFDQGVWGAPCGRPCEPVGQTRYGLWTAGGQRSREKHDY